MDYSQKLQRCGQYIEALQEERRKILVFQRELPLCLDLVTHAIEACKREISGTTTMTENVNGQSECSEQTTGDCGGRPILEEFIPIKQPSSSHEDDHGHGHEDDDEHESHESNEKSDENTKSDWLKSVQLWNQPVPTHKEEHRKEKETVVVDENRKTPATAGSVGGGGGRKNEAEKEIGGKRKHRRCWSQYLHRRFLNALQQLGGAHVATPKQIREVMKVDGLTNDEVKSHLQKYRLHTRRPSSQTVPNKGNQQTPHFVVVGDIWVPQAGYTSEKSAVATSYTAGIYGAVPPQWPSHTNNFGPLISQDRSRRGSEIEVRCGSPVMSSSTRPKVKDGKKS